MQILPLAQVSERARNIYGKGKKDSSQCYYFLKKYSQVGSAALSLPCAGGKKVWELSWKAVIDVS